MVRRDVIRLARGQLVVIVIFAILKAIRKDVVEHTDIKLLHLFLYSFPNFAEAVVGTLTLTMIGLTLNENQSWGISPPNIYLIAVLLAAVYVLLQEFRIHNLGGNNVYDPYDVLFSIIGLLATYFFLRYLKPGVARESNN